MGKGLTSTQQHHTTPRGQTPRSSQQRLFYIGRARPRRRPEPQLATAGRGQGSGSRGGRWRMRHWRLVGCAGSRGCGGGRWRHGEREGSGGGGCGCVSEGRLYFLLPFSCFLPYPLFLSPLFCFLFSPCCPSSARLDPGAARAGSPGDWRERPGALSAPNHARGAAAEPGQPRRLQSLPLLLPFRSRLCIGHSLRFSSLGVCVCERERM